MTINPKAEKTINEIYSKVNIEDYNIKISDQKTLNEKYLKNIKYTCYRIDVRI